MKTVAILTDTHYGCRKNSKEFHDFFNLFYENIFFPILKEHNITTVFHLGDVFDNRKSIDYQSLEWSKQNIFNKLKDYTVHMLVGNHDAYFKNSNKLNSVSLLLDSYSNIIPYDEVTDIQCFDNLITLIPWINLENKANVMQHLSNTKSKTIMGHLEINGFEAHPGHVFEGGLDQEVFSKFKTVFSGHFHHKSRFNNIQYLGNPYEITWSDYGETRGFHLYDVETNKLTFYKNPFSMFKKFYYNDTTNNYNKIDLSEYKNSYIKVIVEEKTDYYTFDKVIQKFYDVGVYDLKIIENTDLQLDKNSDIFEECDDTLTVLQKYIEQMKTDYDKFSLKSIVKSIYTESLEI